MGWGAVRKASTDGPTAPGPANFELTVPQGCVLAASVRPFRMQVVTWDGDEMGVPAFVVLTVAVFAVLGWVQKLVERL